MELATAALSSLLPKLGSLLVDAYNLQKGVRSDIRFLKDEMERMQAALSDLSKLPADHISDVDKLWARDLKELSYDIEDSIDAFTVRVQAGAQPPSLKGFRKFVHKIGLVKKITTRHRIAMDMSEIKSRINEVAERRARYNLPGVAGQPDATTIDPRLTALYEHVERLVGIDGPSEELISLLMKSSHGVRSQELMVVSIVGVGGLGKTTLANSVYERLKEKFDCHAFVSVSLKPDIKKVFGSLLRKLTRQEAGERDLDELISEINIFLRSRRYLIVIDDLWDNEAWEFIKCGLIDNNHGSRVIVTTRNVDVANFSSIGGSTYQLDPLRDKDSKMLFHKRIFREEEEIPSELEEVTNKILTKCGGVPLAIITIASMLASIPHRTKREWDSVYNSMGSGLEKDKSLKNMRQILYLSYDDLPSYLKPCLLYLSMFPEDFEVPRNDLVRLWVAEGFVDESEGSNLYDLGNRYFCELINRSMIQPVDRNQEGTTDACRVHDIILDLILIISGQENFVTMSEDRQLKSSVCKIRRLSLQGSKVDRDEDSKEEQMIQPVTVDVSHVRSLAVFGDGYQWMPPLSRFSTIRILKLGDFPCKNNQVKDLGSLHHLRYLEIASRSEIEHLEGIGNLQLLRTLDLSKTYYNELPASIVQLKQLECLRIHRGMRIPDGIGNLTSLQQLSTFNVASSPNTLAELGNLTELRVLRMWELDTDESYTPTFLKSLSNLQNIQYLAWNSNGGCCPDFDCVSDQWRVPVCIRRIVGHSTICQVPRWFSYLSDLSYLTIRIGRLRQDDLQLLGALPVLRNLTLIVPYYGIVDQPLVIDQPFLALTEFVFRLTTRCYLLVFTPGVMPKLQRLELPCRAPGDGFHIGLEHLTSLEHVTVRLSVAFGREKDGEDTEIKIRNAIGIHPNNPKLKLARSLRAD